MNETHKTHAHAGARVVVLLTVVAASGITGAITAPSGSAASRYDADINATVADIQAY